MKFEPAAFSKKGNLPKLFFLSLAALTVSLALFLPIYSDEIIWKIFMARYWLDNQKGFSVFFCSYPSLLIVSFQLKPIVPVTRASRLSSTQSC